MRTDSEKLQAGIDKVFAWADKHGHGEPLCAGDDVFATMSTVLEDDSFLTFAYSDEFWLIQVEYPFGERDKDGNYRGASKKYSFDKFAKLDIDKEIDEIKKHLDYKKERGNEQPR